MLKNYNALKEALARKNRGRPQEANVCEAPPIWAKLSSDGNIYCHVEPSSERGRVSLRIATLKPDNSLTINIHGYHTPLSCKCVEALTGGRAFVYNGNLWVGQYPVDGLIEFNSGRTLIPPPRITAAWVKSEEMRATITLADLPAKQRLMVELGTYGTQQITSKRVISYLLGQLPKDKLTPRDIYTIVTGGCPAYRILEAAL